MRVLKLGGSLLDGPAWVDRLRRWLARQPPLPSVMIVGGGLFADAVRRLDTAYRLAESDAHWLAIDTMSLTARLVQRLLPEAGWTDDWSAVARWAAERHATLLDATAVECETDRRPLLIFDPRRFLEAAESADCGPPLPHSWEATSDSIAAWIARRLDCDELVLLKSRLPAARVATLDDAAETMLVDRHFPGLAAPIGRVRLVNLRDDDFPEMRLERVPSSSSARNEPM